MRRLNLTVRDLGSAYDLSLEELFRQGDLPDVAVMTPERLDALMRLADSTRRGHEAAADILDSAVLIVLDEVQLLGRLPRGPRLEIFLARLRQKLPEVPILGLAAATRGVADLAAWLRATPIVARSGRPTGTTEILWKSDGTLLQRSADGPFRIGRINRPSAAIQAAADLVLRMRQEKYPILVVETTREYAEDVVRRIANKSPRSGDRWREELTEAQRIILDAAADSADATFSPDNELGRLIRQGLAYHHAGVPAHLLRQIEGLVETRVLRAVGATTTVAEGAHLPFQVVVIPHLNFGGQSAPIERELYENIAGRAGRANVSIEGLVFVIGSDSASLPNYVERELWDHGGQREYEGRMYATLSAPRRLDEYRALREVRSQVLAWLGEEGSYVPDQATHLASRTFTWHTGTEGQRRFVEDQVASILDDLESIGLAEAASPYHLTSLGRRSRLAGISPESCLRLSAEVRMLAENDFFSDLVGITEITDDLANVLASLVMETEEVIEHSLWFRKLRLPDDEAKVTVLRGLMSGMREWPNEEANYRYDLEMLSSWLLGISYADLAQIPPVYSGRGRGIFASTNSGRRASDAAEQMGRLSYPASWAWGAVVAMLGEKGDELPGWIRRAIELGVPTETSVELVRALGLSRAGATRLNTVLSSSWDLGEAELMDISESELRRLGLPGHDRKAINDAFKR